MVNSLELGVTRFGEFYDGDTETPQTRAQLVRKETGIYLQIPWSGEPSEEVYRRWFSSDIEFGDDPERLRYRYSVPEVLAFEDQDGVVALAGCRSHGYKTGRRWRAGAGTVKAQFAVLGTGQPLSYGLIHGLRSEISGLLDWLRVSSVSSGRTVPDPSMWRRIGLSGLMHLPSRVWLVFPYSRVGRSTGAWKVRRF